MNEAIETKMTLQFEAFDSRAIVHKWVLFDRWLPDGINDAVLYESGDESVKIDLWFERHGYLKGDFVEFELNRHEVSEDAMTLQCPLARAGHFPCASK